MDKFPKTSHHLTQRMHSAFKHHLLSNSLTEKYNPTTLFLSITIPLYTFHTISAFLVQNFPKELLWLSELLFVLALLIFILQKNKNNISKPLILFIFTTFIPIFALSNQSILLIILSIISCFPFLYYILWSKTLLFVIGICQILLLYWNQIKFFNYLSDASYEEITHEIINQTLIMCVTSVINVVFCLVFRNNILEHENKFHKMQQKLSKLREQNLYQVKNQERLLLCFSHELNNPLYSISGSLDVMTKHPNFKDFQNLTQKCQTDVKFLHCLVSNILDFSKVQQSSIEICPHEIQPIPFFENLWTSCNVYIKAKGLQSKLIFLNDLPEYISIDNQRLSRIIINLVSNAIKFTNCGFINCLVSWDENRHDKDGVLRIEIVDTGSGIPNHILDTIFTNHNIFADENLDDISTPLKLGLGLYVVKKVLDKMGGTISAVSEKEKGASFTLQIPCEKFAKQKSSKSSIQLQKEKRLKGLVVDDQPWNADINRTFLEKYGVQVLNIAKNGKEAVDYFEKELKANREIDVICMDIEMPIMNGKKAAEKIREIEAKFQVNNCQIVFLSGNSVESEIMECLDVNGNKKANFFLRKPVKIDEFGCVIEKIKSLHNL